MNIVLVLTSMKKRQINGDEFTVQKNIYGDSKTSKNEMHNVVIK